MRVGRGSSVAVSFLFELESQRQRATRQLIDRSRLRTRYADKVLIYDQLMWRANHVPVANHWSQDCCVTLLSLIHDVCTALLP